MPSKKTTKSIKKVSKSTKKVSAKKKTSVTKKKTATKKPRTVAKPKTAKKVKIKKTTKLSPRAKKIREIKKKLIEWRDNLPKEWVEPNMWKVDNKKLTYMTRASTGSCGCNYRLNLLDDIMCPQVCKECPYDIRFNHPKEDL